MGLHVTFEAAGEGELCSLEGEVAVLVAPRAYAPGAPVALRVALPAVLGDAVEVAGAAEAADGSGASAAGAGASVAVEGKSTGCKRRADGRFDLRLRVVSMRREIRERIRAACHRVAPG